MALEMTIYSGSGGEASKCGFLSAAFNFLINIGYTGELAHTTMKMRYGSINAAFKYLSLSHQNHLANSKSASSIFIIYFVVVNESRFCGGRLADGLTRARG